MAYSRSTAYTLHQNMLGNAAIFARLVRGSTSPLHFKSQQTLFPKSASAHFSTSSPVPMHGLQYTPRFLCLTPRPLLPSYLNTPGAHHLHISTDSNISKFPKGPPHIKLSLRIPPQILPISYTSPRSPHNLI